MSELKQFSGKNYTDEEDTFVVKLVSEQKNVTGNKNIKIGRDKVSATKFFERVIL